GLRVDGYRAAGRHAARSRAYVWTHRRPHLPRRARPRSVLRHAAPARLGPLPHAHRSVVSVWIGYAPRYRPERALRAERGEGDPSSREGVARMPLRAPPALTAYGRFLPRIAFSVLGVLGVLSAPVTSLISQTPPPLQGFTTRSSAIERGIERRFLALPSPDRAREAHAFLTAEPHVAGSPRDRAIAEW